MIINITNRNDKVSIALKEKIEGWLKESQGRYDIITSAQVTLDKKDGHDEVEATIHAAGREVFARATGDNLYAALNALSHKIDRQLSKIRDKQQSKKGCHKISESLANAAEIDAVEEVA